MAAQCTGCAWTGTSTQVVDGKCPECRSPITYNRAPIEKAPEMTLADFNRRAAIALKAVSFGVFNSSGRVAGSFFEQQEAGEVSEKMQQAIFNIVHRYRTQITDQTLLDYAASRARGQD